MNNFQHNVKSLFREIGPVILTGWFLTLSIGTIYANCPESSYYSSYYYEREKMGTSMLFVEYLRDGIDYLIIVSVVVVLILAIRDFIRIRRRRIFPPDVTTDELSGDLNNNSSEVKYIQDKVYFLKRIPRKYIQISIISIVLILLSVLLSMFYVVSALINTGQSLYALVPTWIYNSLAIVIEGFVLGAFSYGIYIIIKWKANVNLRILNDLTDR